MTTPDRLYALLPAIVRQRDQLAGEPLRALLGIVGEQVDVVQRDIEQLYDNWFIETCEDWVVPYIGELVGYGATGAADPSDDDYDDYDGDDDPDDAASGAPAIRLLAPRRDVADTLRQRRRKGSLALLEATAASVAGWPCRVVEFDRLVGAAQSMKHPSPGRGGPVDVRAASRRAAVGSAFDTTAHGVDVRRPSSRRGAGRYNLPSVGVFVWRLRAFPVTRMPACCIDRSERANFTFSVLGNDAPLFNAPAADVDADDALPVPLTRAMLADDGGRVAARHYGERRSLALWRRQGHAVHLVPREQVFVADLTDWRTRARPGTVAVDPRLGRISFAAEDVPEHGLLVSYHQGFADALGGGEYARPAGPRRGGALRYVVGPQGDCRDLDEALARWHADAPPDAVIELSVNDVFADPPTIALRPQQRLEIRATDGVRPLIDLRNRHRDAREFLAVHGEPGSALVLTGLLVAGRGLQVKGHLGTLRLSHCTLVPGWDLAEEPEHRDDVVPSLRLDNVATRVDIDHAILGAITVLATVPELDPVALTITDSIVDATARDRRAIDAPERQAARVRLTIARSTLIGRVHVAELASAADSLFDGELRVERAQAGCLRFCHVPAGSRTPPRFACQPDTALARHPTATPEERARLEARLQPRFTSRRYGDPGYAQLAGDGARELATGAEDGSEMGVFHDLHEAQRLAHLRARLADGVPAGCDVGILKET